MTRSKLPARWRRIGKRQFYYYSVPKGQEDKWDGKQTFKLGETESEAWRTYLDRIGIVEIEGEVTMNDVFDRWWNEYVMTQLKESTRESYGYHLLPLRKVFGHIRPRSVKPVHAYAYRNKRPRVAGNREVSVLSSALTYAVEIGIIECNPLRGQVSRRGAASERPRTRIPSLEELEAFCKVNPHLRGYVTLKRITGLRQGQLLAINLTEHWDGEGLRPPTSKGGKDTIYRGDGLRAAINGILGSRLPRGPLFLNKQGRVLSSSGFRSSWRRAQQRYIKKGGTRFNEHDIRKTVAMQAESLEEAQRLLGHQEPKTTAQVYRIGTVEVEVLE